MESDASPEKSPIFPLQDVSGDTERAEHQPHDHAADVVHAKHHLKDNNFWFLCVFLPVILATVVAFNVDFGAYNPEVTWFLAALRSACIAWFLAHLFKDFSLVFRTLFFTLIFLAGMIFLSLWDSELVDKSGRGIGNPIWDKAHPESMHE